MAVKSYQRDQAVAYAHQWAYGRNPAFYNYESIGGDCTNFASQCLFAGGGIMDYTHTFGWYYRYANDKSPAWTGVAYLYQYLLRRKLTPGPVGEECDIHDLQPGDIVQISFNGNAYQHCPIVVTAEPPFLPQNIKVAAHSYNADNRPLDTYEAITMRFVHITGIRE